MFQNKTLNNSKSMKQNDSKQEIICFKNNERKCFKKYEANCFKTKNYMFL